MTPRGVQLWLGTGTAPHMKDTLVMSNLGYFQLKAAPGAWNLSLAPGAPLNADSADVLKPECCSSWNICILSNCSTRYTTC